MKNERARFSNISTESLQRLEAFDMALNFSNVNSKRVRTLGPTW